MKWTAEDPILVHGTFNDHAYVLQVNERPTLPGQLTLTLSHAVSTLSADHYACVWCIVKELTASINASSEIPIRYAVGTDGGTNIEIYPIQPRSQPWQPVLYTERSYTDRDPGYVSSQAGPRACDSSLDEMKNGIIRTSGWSNPSFAFDDPSDDNLFARLCRGEIPQWRLWEDESHVAFLTPFPNRPGFTVVIPRRHLSSDILSLRDHDFHLLMKAVHHVSRILMEALNVKRVGMFCEGFEIDYTHVKLLPVPTEVDEIAPGGDGSFYNQYPGFLTTQRGPRRSVDDTSMLLGQEKLKQDLALCTTKLTERFP